MVEGLGSVAGALPISTGAGFAELGRIEGCQSTFDSGTFDSKELPGVEDLAIFGG